MGESAERAEAWRKAKRSAGYKPWLLWVPLAFPGRVAAVAHQHKQDLVECLVTALERYATEGRKSVGLSARDIDMIARQMLKLQAQEDTPVPPREEGIQEEASEPILPCPHCGERYSADELRSRCGECGHHYPKSGKKCNSEECKASRASFKKARENIQTLR